MKNVLFILTFIISILFGLHTSAQEYFPFPEENASWSLNNSSWEPTFDYRSVLKIQGDTIISNVNYKMIVEKFPDWQNYPSQDIIKRLFALYRQDTINKKVYVIRVYLNETEEKLLYDFNENIGEIVSLPGLAYFEYVDDTTFTLEQINEVSMYDGTIRNKFKFRSVNHTEIIHFVIEGIGSDQNPFGSQITYLYPENYGSVMLFLKCFTLDEQLIFVENDPTDCGDINIRVNTVFKNKELICYPNPASNYINFESPNSETIKHLRIFNSMGQLIEVLDINQAKFQWNCQSLALGIYSYEVEIGDIIYRGKFLHR